MPFFAYVLKSATLNAFYKGHCEDLCKRLKAHNSGDTKSIKHGIPWEVVYYEEFETREQSILREKYFKSSTGRRYLKNKLGLY
jgi:putative endonuclease